MTAGSRAAAGAPGRPRVLMLSLVFAPDGVSTAQLMTELAVDLRRDGCPVTVVTTRPHYNVDAVAQAAQPLTPVWPGLLWRSEIQGVTVYHTRVGAKNGGLLARALGWLVFHALAALAALRFVPRADVIFVPSPLLTLGLLGRAIALPLRARLVYNVQELYPDLAIELGMVRNRVLIRVLQWLERAVYRGAASVTTITDGMRTAVVRKGIPDRRVTTIPNFVDVSTLVPAPKQNAFGQAHGWTDRFVVLYAGNMGYMQGLEVLLDAAHRLREDPEVLFAFVGAGVAKRDLERRAAELALTNVEFVDHQPYAAVPAIYAAADVCVAALDGEILIGALPSKVYRIMACERPVLALCDRRSDLADLVTRVDAGVVCTPGDVGAISDAILGLKARPDDARDLGRNGRAYVMAHMSRGAVTRRYIDLFETLAEAGAR